MSTIQFSPAELNWANAVIAAAHGSKSFLATFCEAALRADSDNYEVIRPALLRLMLKYGAPPLRLAAEGRDNP